MLISSNGSKLENIGFGRAEGESKYYVPQHSISTITVIPHVGIVGEILSVGGDAFKPIRKPPKRS